MQQHATYYHATTCNILSMQQACDKMRGKHATTCEDAHKPKWEDLGHAQISGQNDELMTKCTYKHAHVMVHQQGIKITTLKHEQ